MSKKIWMSLIGICILITIGISDARAIEIAGLVAAWTFDEGEGKVARDVSGNGHDGRIIKAKWVKGKFGQALSFGPSNPSC